MSASERLKELGERDDQLLYDGPCHYVTHGELLT